METLVKEQTTKKNQLVDIGKGIKVGVVNITPEQAEKMLEHNLFNRRIKKQKISQYAFDMESGLWQMNGVPLVFNHNGELLDGQNRLHAIIRSGVSCEMLIVTGIARAAFQTIDTGSNRNGTDVLTIIGLPIEKAQYLSALINRIYRDSIGNIGTAWGDNPRNPSRTNSYNKNRVTLTNQLIIDYYKEHNQELDDVYDFCIKHKRQVSRLMRFPVYLFSFYKLRKINLIEAEDFFTKLAKGDMLSSEDPIYHLREKMFEIKTLEVGKKPPAWHYPGYIYKAWNAYRKGAKMKKLTIRSVEEEPVMPI